MYGAGCAAAPQLWARITGSASAIANAGDRHASRLRRELERYREIRSGKARIALTLVSSDPLCFGKSSGEHRAQSRRLLVRRAETWLRRERIRVGLGFGPQPRMRSFVRCARREFGDQDYLGHHRQHQIRLGLDLRLAERVLDDQAAGVLAVTADLRPQPLR